MEEPSRFQQLRAHVKRHHAALAAKHPRAHRALKWALLTPLALFAALVVFTLIFIVPTLPDIDNLQQLTAAQSSVIYDRNGVVLYTIHGDENRKTVPFEAISPNAIHASLAIEDDQFYSHFGIDFGALARAVCSEIHLCSKPRGGSTITQQFIKNAFLSSERTYTRKLKEIILSLELEAKYSKDEILDLYFNRIPYGSNVYGVETAAQTFFGKPAKDLTIAEGALIAAITNAPTYYSPYGTHKYAQINLDSEEILKNDIRSEEDLVDYNPDLISKGLIGKTYVFGGPLPPAEPDTNAPGAVSIYVKGRVDFVLERMRDLGYITKDEFDQAREEAKAKEFKPFREQIKAPHFVMWIREQLEQKYGKEQIEKGGLKITTTLDAALQDFAEAAVAKQGDSNEKRYNAKNASLVSMNPDTGEVLAMVGSRDYWNEEIDGNVNIALRPRLPGSSFKPIVYAAAFLQGFAPATVLYDVQTKFGGWYEPDNYDGTFHGPISIRQALANSLNIPAVKATHLTGVANVIDLARKMGIQLNQPDDWYGLSLGLGAGEVRLIDLAGAYGTFASGGYKVNPVAILKVEDKKGNILEEYEPPRQRELILDPQVAYLINDVLSDVDARPAGFWRGQITIPGRINAAKTGTSNKKINEINYPFDTWTMGFTRHLVTGVWVGNSDGTHLSGKADGLGAASPIWLDYMINATKDMPNDPFDKPEGIKWVQVSKRSGKLPSEYTPAEDRTTEVFASFSVPKEYDPYEVVEIDKVSGKLATEFTPDAAREKKGFFVHHSELPDDPTWEGPVRAWAKENHQDEEPPTEYDDVHTAQSVNAKPTIVIKSPVAQSSVSAPNVGVVVDVSSPVDIDRVEYYWDDGLVGTVKQPPFKGQFRIAKDEARGSVHTIKAIVFDALFNSNQTSISVKIGSDTAPPVARFVYPESNESIAAGSTATAQVDAFDPDGDVQKVEYYLDGALSATVKTAPYFWQFTVPDQLGDHSLKAVAYDFAQNQTRVTVDFESIAAAAADAGGNFRIVKPSSNQTFDQGENVFLSVYLDPETRANLDQLIVLGKKGDGTFEIARADGGASGGSESYSFIWGGPTAGVYDLSLKVVLKDGKIRFSDKVPIVVR